VILNYGYATSFEPSIKHSNAHLDGCKLDNKGIIGSGTTTPSTSTGTGKKLSKSSI
jgi:hypothetical protein